MHSFLQLSPAHAAYLQKNKQPNQKWAEDLNKHFSKEDIEMANKHMKICLTSLIIREMNIKIMIRYNFKTVRMTIIEKSTNSKR